MEGEGEVAAVQAEGEQQQPVSIQPGSPEWYFRASAIYSSLIISGGLDQIYQYTADVDAHAHNLAVLWMTDPFPRDQFIQQAVSIIERSEALENNVTTLRNTVVRFLHSGNSDEMKRLGSRRGRRRVLRRQSAPALPEDQDPGQQDGGIQ